MRHLHHKYIYLITYLHVNEPLLEGFKHRHTGPLHAPSGPAEATSYNPHVELPSYDEHG